jgi:hypothetical protein
VHILISSEMKSIPILVMDKIPIESYEPGILEGINRCSS